MLCLPSTITRVRKAMSTCRNEHGQKTLRNVSVHLEMNARSYGLLNDTCRSKCLFPDLRHPLFVNTHINTYPSTCSACDTKADILARGLQDSKPTGLLATFCRFVGPLLEYTPTVLMGAAPTN